MERRSRAAICCRRSAVAPTPICSVPIVGLRPMIAASLPSTTASRPQYRAGVAIYALYADPPLGQVGMTLNQARASGRNVLKAEVPVSSVSRAILEGQDHRDTDPRRRVHIGIPRRNDPGAAWRRPHPDHRYGNARRRASVRDALPIHPLMAEFIPSALWSLKPLDGFLRSHVGWVMPAGGAGTHLPSLTTLTRID